MSFTNTATTKTSLKLLEVPLNKFREEVIPHHQSIFERHKATVLKLISLNDVNQVIREVRDKKRVVKQLKDLMYELETLRAQVEQSELDKFDQKSLSLRRDIITLRTGYDNLEKLAQNLEQKNKPHSPDDGDTKENVNPFEGAPKIQLEESLDYVKLKDVQETLTKVENIHRDINDLHEVYSTINEMVGEQSQNVDHIEEAVESANKNVQAGTWYLAKTHKLKSAAYPVTGAFLGGLIGGPIGLVAGLKVGGVAAVACAASGYIGGIFVKKKINENGTPPTINTTADVESEDQKKDI